MAKIFFVWLLIIFASIFISAWAFNHINPWVGIATFFIISYFIVLYIEKKIKNK